MMRVISVLGRKGGSGKTHISHMLSYGLGMLNHPVLMFQTDVRTLQPPELLKNRPYFLMSVTGDPKADAEQMDDAFSRARLIPNSVLVIDGGANRRNVDFAVLAMSHLVLIPVGNSPEDVSVAVADYKDLRRHCKEIERDTPIFFVLNRWPGDKRRQDMLMSRMWVRNFLEDHAEKRLPLVVHDLTSSQDIACHDGPVVTNLFIERKAEELGRLVADMLSLPTIVINADTGEREVLETHPSPDIAAAARVEAEKPAAAA